jgi:uncharacterized damage-inducible protein DinB
MSTSKTPEPWLRGTLSEVPAVQRAVLHALELAGEDVRRWCAGLSLEEINCRPDGLPSVGFHLRHIVGSIDRLLTYTEGRALSQAQLDVLEAESSPVTSVYGLAQEIENAIQTASVRVRSFSPAAFEQPRTVGRSKLPTTLGGLLVHVADHTQRHVGQAVTTAKLMLARRKP